MKIRLFYPLVAFLILMQGCAGSTSRYEPIVDQIEAMNLPEGQLKKFKVADFENPEVVLATETEKPVRGQGKGMIWAAKLSGELVIFIETEDKGHAGEYGVAYSENGGVPAWDHDAWGEFWTTGKQLNTQWWEISYRLD